MSEPQKTHWEHVYREKGPEGVSWFHREARIALDLIQRNVPDRAARILDAGGGASRLVDGLLDDRYEHVTVADIAGEAIRQAQARLGARAPLVDWREGDILDLEFAPASFDVWHDRAVFHFLTAAGDRARYAEQVRRALRPGGILIVATFAQDGPTRCSGLDVRRYGPAELAAEFGSAFEPLHTSREDHQTPWGAAQAFTWFVARLTNRGHQ
jgi:SAM-dependent methyltransferase